MSENYESTLMVDHGDYLLKNYESTLMVDHGDYLLISKVSFGSSRYLYSNSSKSYKCQKKGFVLEIRRIR